MTQPQIKQWLLDNLPNWPLYETQCINIPFGSWHWWKSGFELVVLHIETGEIVTKKEFLDARYEQRLKPCGMSFKEMIEDLCR